jgi:hypothetical protein
MRAELESGDGGDGVDLNRRLGSWNVDERA